MKKSAEKSAALWLVSASGSAFFFSKGERERERVRHFEERANALINCFEGFEYGPFLSKETLIFCLFF